MVWLVARSEQTRNFGNFLKIDKEKFLTNQKLIRGDALIHTGGVTITNGVFCIHKKKEV